MKTTYIQDEQRTIELIEEKPKQPPTSVWIISHPHPMHEGAMNNKIIYTLSRNALMQNAISIRYNFRGVGKSTGTFSNNFEEKTDLIYVWQWVKSKYINLDIILAGFSFGAYISILCEPIIKPQALILIAPPVGKSPYEFKHQNPTCPTLVIIGKKDEITNPALCLSWATDQIDADAFWINHSGHFFHGQLTRLKYLINAWIST